MIRALTLLTWMTRALVLLPGVVLAAPTADETIDACIVDVGSELDARATAALQRVQGTGRQLLALRSYLRSRLDLVERWSWTDDQIHAYKTSAEQQDLIREIDRVREAFVAANPGYELWVNPQVRSLDVQLENWNNNVSVESAGAKLLDALKAHVGPSGSTRGCPAHANAAIERFLLAYVPSPPPTLAAPGLSPHGQMRAVDFQVHRDGKVIAGPSAATIDTDWDMAGWASRLDEAVRSTSARFLGPLEYPREPWHYTFVPDPSAQSIPDARTLARGRPGIQPVSSSSATIDSTRGANPMPR